MEEEPQTAKRPRTGGEPAEEGAPTAQSELKDFLKNAGISLVKDLKELVKDMQSKGVSNHLILLYLSRGYHMNKADLQKGGVNLNPLIRLLSGFVPGRRDVHGSIVDYEIRNGGGRTPLVATEILNAIGHRQTTRYLLIKDGDMISFNHFDLVNDGGRSILYCAEVLKSVGDDSVLEEQSTGALAFLCDMLPLLPLRSFSSLTSKLKDAATVVEGRKLGNPETGSVNQTFMKLIGIRGLEGLLSAEKIAQRGVDSPKLTFLALTLALLGKESAPTDVKMGFAISSGFPIQAIEQLEIRVPRPVKDGESSPFIGKNSEMVTVCKASNCDPESVLICINQKPRLQDLRAMTINTNFFSIKRNVEIHRLQAQKGDLPPKVGDAIKGITTMEAPLFNSALALFQIASPGAKEASAEETTLEPAQAEADSFDLDELTM